MAGSRWRRNGTLGSGGRAASPLAASLNGGSMKQGRGGLGTARPTVNKNAGAGLVTRGVNKNNPRAKRKINPRRRRLQGCAGEGPRGRKTPGTHCTCAKRKNQTTRRAKRRGLGWVRGSHCLCAKAHKPINLEGILQRPGVGARGPINGRNGQKKTPGRAITLVRGFC
jgi:hypothetical protein